MKLDHERIAEGVKAWGISLILVIVLLLIAHSYASAHDHARPDLDGWFKSLQSRGKSPCCDGSDATSLEDPDWDTKDGHYRVRLEGQWVDVPDPAVIDGPNRDGRAMVWPMHMNGYPAVRCFLPGSMT